MLFAVVGPVFSGWTQTASQKFLPNHLPARVQGLQPIGRLSRSENLHLAIGLPLRNSQRLTNFLQQVYDPGSTNYHHYLTPDQFTEQFGPAKQDYQAVINFATSNGLEVAAAHDSRMVLDVSGKASDVESAFHVILRTYQHPSEARTFYAPDVTPSVDAGLPILDVEGLSDYALPRPALHPQPQTGIENAQPPSGSGPGGNYMGYDFRNAYAPGVALDGTGQMVGLLELEGYYAADILNYESLTGLPNVPLQNILIDSFSGTPGTNDSEAALDIEMAISMAPGLTSVVVFEGPDSNSSFLDILDAMASQNQIKQFSSSWGSALGANPNALLDSVFQKMAAQGQSFLQASGDGDAWVNPIAVPSASPYVTSVGGTSLNLNGAGGTYASETVWNTGNLGTNHAWADNGNGYWGSGGGVSPAYAIPAWQKTVSMAANNGSTSERNIPDVALTAANVWVIHDNGASGGFIGTSCAAPLWAGFIALVNQQAAANGSPAVGFVNPALYAIGAGKNYTNCFHDITAGNNTNASSPTKYFAVKGYDLCTGWGTPAGQALIDALAPVDALGIAPAAGWRAWGPVGGPFTNSPGTGWLTNAGGLNLKWTCINTSLWLSVTPTNGTLAAGQSEAVSVSLKTTTGNLPAGIYAGSILFSNLSDGVVQARQVWLQASPRATMGTYDTTLLSLNPVAYWQLNETNLPPGADLVTNAGSLGVLGNGFPYNAVFQGATGIVNHCYAFSNPGLTDAYLGSHVDVPFNLAFNSGGPFAVEFWARPNQYAPNYLCPVSSIDETQNGQKSRWGWIFYEAHTNQWVFRVGNYNGYAADISGGSVQTDVWQHVAGVYDGTNVILYVNGVKVAGPTSASGYGPNTNAAVPLRIGATGLGSYTFDGALDELAFYTNALSSNTVAAHYRAAATNNAGYGRQILASQPVGYWHFDEPAYTAPAANTLPTAFNLGSLSSGCNGAYQPGSVPGVAGVPGANFGSLNLACAFAADSCIDIPGAELGFTGPITITAWLKTPPPASQAQAVVSLGADLYQLTLDELGNPHFSDGPQSLGDLVGTNSLADGQWHQLVGIYDGTSSEFLYVDGQLAAQSAAATASPAANGNDLWIGGDPDPGTLQFFNGVIDEVAIFTNVLSPDAVLALFMSGTQAASLKTATVSVATGDVALTLATVSGKRYLVESCPDLAQGNWSVLGPPVTATNTSLSILDATGLATQRFYRAFELP